jgi:hypothetical protein
MEATWVPWMEFGCLSCLKSIGINQNQKKNKINKKYGN